MKMASTGDYLRIFVPDLILHKVVPSKSTHMLKHMVSETTELWDMLEV